MFDTITVRGFAATKPDLRTLPDGTPVASFRLASTPRRFDAESSSWVDVGPTNWYTVSCFRRMAGNAASSLKVGDAVLVMGRLRLRPWTTKEGHERVTVEIDASSLGPDLAMGTATYRRSGGHQGPDGSRDQSAEHGDGAAGDGAQDRGDTRGLGEAAESSRRGWPDDGRVVDPLTGELLSGRRLGPEDEGVDEESTWEGDPDELLAGAERAPAGA